ncbi:TonB-dependent receptor domain-containing protein [Enterovirga rhinocerotis]|uniref:Hemoglobin/transferrin/lactoferrin receptor protein n=1 Tax=Enterovirga rhinocerotis TaxID=1339210 RepID=A0A4R7BU35_9HYPH|nr:TonB-dependent receptor [Enterovirga rhinocerotis]TDR88893.1 hemoglobin/transferrin/lactoferrin receptor protein [Enterovirga rhinocerotis]
MALRLNGSDLAGIGRRALVAALLATTALAGGMAGAGDAYAQAQTTFDVPAGSLNRALAAFGRQSGTQLSYDASLASGKSSAGFRGQGTRQEAIARILQGSGLSHSFTDARSVLITGPAPAARGGAAANGSILLDTIEVSGRSGVSNADTPYETPGSVSFISREEIDRLPPTSPGDILINAPGVLNGGNRVGNSISPNIRGLQGMGRVNTTVDGALNATTSYRGYAGNRDETYIDPDLIGGVDIIKGPSAGVGTGAIGGNIAMRTLAAGDIVKADQNWGIRIKGDLGTNTRSPVFDTTTTLSNPLTRPKDRPPSFNGDSFSGSIAAATMQEHVEGIFAISRRKQGNYFAGSMDAERGFVYPIGSGLNPGRNAVIRPGEEVYNTSQDTTSILAKGKLKWDNGQSFELGYMRYFSSAGEEDEALINNPSYSFGQRKLSKTTLDTYTAKYRYEPSDNPLVNLRVNLWLTDLEHRRGEAYPVGFRNHNVVTLGGDVTNTARFDTALGPLTLDSGAEFRRERAEAPQRIEGLIQNSRGPNGNRLLSAGFGRLTFEPVNWLKLSAGARFDHYHAEGEGIASIFPDRSGSRLSPNFGAVITPFEGFQLFAEYKEGYRPPSLRELYWEMFSLQVNPNLKGEVSKGWEFGFNVLRDNVLTDGDKLRFKATYFQNKYDNYIIVDDVPGTMNNPRQQFTNIDRANYDGFELSGSYDTGTFFAQGNFTKYIKAEYCKRESGCTMPRLDEVLGNVTPPTYVPPEWSGSVTGGVRLFDQALTLGGRVYFASTRIGSKWPPAASRTPGLIGLNYTWPQFAVFDLFGSYKLGEDTVLDFSIQNLTDKYYYDPLATTGMPSPGRTARIGLTHRFGGNSLPAFPALPRLGNASAGAPGEDWTGLYAGFHLGHARAEMSGSVTTASGGPAPTSEAPGFVKNGTIGGAQIGFNYQFDNRVLVGIESDFTFLGKKGDATRTMATETASLAASGAIEADTQYKLDWMTTLRGRVGYSFGRFMVYGTGGAAFLQASGRRQQYRATQLTASPTSTAYSFTDTDTKTDLGWTAGAGFEYAITSNWSLRGEYAYAGFDNGALSFDQARGGVKQPITTWTSCRRGSPNPPCPAGYTGTLVNTVPGSVNEVSGREASTNIGLHMLKVGLNYRF